jgi:CubicO group peptidase (beta-lactamase class C family)
MVMRRRSVFELPTLVGMALTSILGPATSYAADAEAQVRMHQVESHLAPTIPPDGRQVHAITLQQRMAALHVPGISIAVVHNGNIDWAKGYGVAWVGGPAVTTETLFQAASISKPVTALAVLHLVDSGKIALDHEVNSYLKDWKIPETPATAASKVTVTELLNHTAGIHLEGFPGYGSSEMIPTLPQILRGEPPAYGPAITVTSVPGSEFRYAGGGYVVLRKLLTDVTGQPFEALMRSSVFLPLGMEHSTFQEHLPSELAATAGAARCPRAAVQTGRPYLPGGSARRPMDHSVGHISVHSGNAEVPQGRRVLIEGHSPADVNTRQGALGIRSDHRQRHPASILHVQRR